MVTPRSTLRLPCPDHYGPKSCHNATKSRGNPWLGGLLPVKLDPLSLPSMSSVPTTLINASSLSLTSPIPKPDYPCQLVASWSFELTDVASAFTPQGRLQPHVGYVFAYKCTSVVHQIVAWWRESPNQQIVVADVYPDATSGLIELTVSNVPRDIQLELVFVTNGTHQGIVGLYQVLEHT